MNFFPRVEGGQQRTISIHLVDHILEFCLGRVLTQ